jgi:PIN domain nuclease of toxin-antitoxin system
MRILLDTHIFLWFISGDTQLSIDVRDAIRDRDNEVYLSAISVWEAIVKYQLGKLPLPEHPKIYLPKQRDLHQIDQNVRDGEIKLLADRDRELMQLSPINYPISSTKGFPS